MLRESEIKFTQGTDGIKVETVSKEAEIYSSLEDALHEKKIREWAKTARAFIEGTAGVVSLSSAATYSALHETSFIRQTGIIVLGTVLNIVLSKDSYKNYKEASRASDQRNAIAKEINKLQNNR
jgi:hypothetical protein